MVAISENPKYLEFGPVKDLGESGDMTEEQFNVTAPTATTTETEEEKKKREWEEKEMARYPR